MSNTAQVTEDVVKSRVGVLTCLKKTQNCAECLLHLRKSKNQWSNGSEKSELMSCVRSHLNENPQDSKAIPLCHGHRQVGVDLWVVVHHMELCEGREKNRLRLSIHINENKRERVGEIESGLCTGLFFDE